MNFLFSIGLAKDDGLFAYEFIQDGGRTGELGKGDVLILKKVVQMR